MTMVIKIQKFEFSTGHGCLKGAWSQFRADNNRIYRFDDWNVFLVSKYPYFDTKHVIWTMNI